LLRLLTTVTTKRTLPDDPNTPEPFKLRLPEKFRSHRPLAPSLSFVPVARLARDGGYERLLPTGVLPEPGRVFRKWCSGCNTNFTLLPNDVVPSHSFGLELICSRLTASLAGQPDRSRDFYEEHELIPDERDEQELQSEAGKGTSWSDCLNDKPLRPSHRLFAHWRRKWPLRAQAIWLFCLYLACLHDGCDLRTKLGLSLEKLVACAEPMRALPIAMGLVALLQEEPDVWASFPSTVILLACSPSHKIARAAGRPPPQYGGALEFPDSGRTQNNGGHNR